MKTYFLYPSNIFVSKEEYEVTTILGSCVAITLWDTELQFGGINHFMLPRWNGKDLKSPMYGDIAINMLINKMSAYGSKTENLRAKLFGGANILNLNNKITNIGSNNIEIAISLLNKFRIPIIAQDIGGNTARKLIFNTKTGKTLIKYINPQQP